MYSVPDSLWISVVEMHMDGPTGRWFQSVESKLRSSSWLEFCRLLHDRFDRDQKELLIRELFHIRQTTIVPDYITRFTELIDQLSSYSSDTDPMYFTMRFIDGLRPDIKSIVLVMWPQTLDTACTIALLQEEAAGAVVPVPGRRGDWSPQLCLPPPPARPALPLPPPPPHPERPAVQQHQPSSSTSPGPQSAEAKLSALKTYRRALGLCYKCGTKWSKEHRCSPEVLQAVDALWDSFSSDDSLADSEPDSTPAEQLMLALSKLALSGIPAARTIGSLADIPVQILVDSGRSSSFVNQSLVPHLPHIRSDQVSSNV